MNNSAKFEFWVPFYVKKVPFWSPFCSKLGPLWVPFLQFLGLLEIVEQCNGFKCLEVPCHPKLSFSITLSVFQDVKTPESISNVVDVAVANFIKDVQNL